jgi:hypothetical protein
LNFVPSSPFPSHFILISKSFLIFYLFPFLLYASKPQEARAASIASWAHVSKLTPVFRISEARSCRSLFMTAAFVADAPISTPPKNKFLLTSPSSLQAVR